MGEHEIVKMADEYIGDIEHMIELLGVCADIIEASDDENNPQHGQLLDDIDRVIDRRGGGLVDAIQADLQWQADDIVMQERAAVLDELSVLLGWSVRWGGNNTSVTIGRRIGIHTDPIKAAIRALNAA